ncbi:hypothetical protein BU25DRAFT_462885 [Macroventuria anomochaeta]|uniref:Uncharacterized protein n=1 Tax=Macroventuria anomochaeta TaxID=301207 RepID=A0ACB6RKL0_9PLEO|nr:uncharacterized protein BU25DRAFT_462885 [Macroventuria anomochaeta]KAF2622338.1 hypothetical protein BU25DRAFT_462885 [Macroventuria anomochaeta]
MAPESDPLQLILAELASIKAGNEAMQQTLAQQEAQHRSNLATLRQDFEERLAVIQHARDHPEVWEWLLALPADSAYNLIAIQTGTN